MKLNSKAKVALAKAAALLSPMPYGTNTFYSKHIAKEDAKNFYCNKNQKKSISRQLFTVQLELANIATYFNQSGVWHQEFVAGAPIAGLIDPYGFKTWDEIKGKLLLCVNSQEAFQLNLITGHPVIAINTFRGLETVSRELKSEKPTLQMVFVLTDELGSSEECKNLRRVSSEYQLPVALATSPLRKGKEIVCTESIKDAICKAEVLAYDLLNDAEDSNLRRPSSYQPVSDRLVPELCASMERFVSAEIPYFVVMALFSAFSYQYQHFKTCPNLLISSPMRECGKTTVLDFLSKILNHPVAMSNTSEAAVFRLGNEGQLTGMFDEAETYLKDRASALAGIINSGHSRAQAFVSRANTGKEGGVKRYSTFYPKVIAGNGDFYDTLMSRSFTIYLERALASAKLENLDEFAIADLLFQGDRIQAWALKTKRISGYYEKLNWSSARAEDNARPLLAVAAALGENTLLLARDALEELQNLSAPATVNEQEVLLADIRNVFMERNTWLLATEDLITQLCRLEDKPWATIDKGGRISPHLLARSLKHFKLRGAPAIETKQFREGSRIRRGYEWDKFQPFFDRYLKPYDEAKNPWIDRIFA
jgi:hypothetical protein